MMNGKRIACFVLLLGIVSMAGVSSGDAQTSYQTIKNPPSGSVYYVLLQGLILIKDSKFDQWLSSYRDQDGLNDNKKKALKKYDLPVLERMAPDFLKENNTALYVTRVDGDPQSDTVLKIFLLGKPGQSPRPFWMIKVNNVWKFQKP